MMTSPQLGKHLTPAKPTNSHPGPVMHESLTIKYLVDGTDGAILMNTVDAEACKLIGLEIEFLCGYPDDTALFWEVVNPFDDKDFTFTWKVEGSTESGTETVPALDTVTFTTSLGKTIIIYVNGHDVDRADSGDPCRFNLGLEYVCLDSGEHSSTVTDINTFDIAYTWYLDAIAQGKATVPTGGTTNFTTSNDEHSVMLKHIDNPFGEKWVSSDAEICEMPHLPGHPLYRRIYVS